MTAQSKCPIPDTVAPRWVKCPGCGQPSPYAPDNPFRPFCSKLCRATDLGRWAQEEFKVAAPAPDNAEELG
ncbi:MAG TPA: DNA gyrase inhibitor YacG [Burkholderiaceae bacterium]|nr:DNA gyrase inhibitor YacG [Burkholderiaceae bacterium]